MPTDYDALEVAAAALRRLNRAIAGYAASRDELHELAGAAHDLAAALERGTRRDKADEMAEVLGFGNGEMPHPFPLGEDGRVEFDPFSAGGGRFHPASVGLDLRRESDDAVVGTVVVDPMFQGPPGRVHGGIVALIADEVMSAVNRLAGRRAFTARLTVNLRAPAPIGTELTMRAWLHDVQGRKVTIHATGRSAEGRFLDADGLFVVGRDDPA